MLSVADSVISPWLVTVATVTPSAISWKVNAAPNARDFVAANSMLN